MSDNDSSGDTIYIRSSVTQHEFLLNALLAGVRVIVNCVAPVYNYISLCQCCQTHSLEVTHCHFVIVAPDMYKHRREVNHFHFRNAQGIKFSLGTVFMEEMERGNLLP